MVEVFREVKRVLRDDGTLWLNLGVSYAGSATVGEPRYGSARADGIIRTDGLEGGDPRGPRNRNGLGRVPDIKPKDLIGIPWRVAFALQEDGWYLRNDIIWHKTNSMPESVTDRCTRGHEYLFLLTKSSKYFFDADAIKEVALTHQNGPHGIGPKQPEGTMRKDTGNASFDNGTRNKRTVWSISTQPFKGAHFATFPVKLVEPCIMAGSSERGACGKCGAPYKRIIEKGAPDLEHQQACGGDANGEYESEGIKDYAEAGVQNPSEVKARILAGMVTRRTTGWEPTCACQCPSDDITPCLVLDPFTGSGTTGAVAVTLHRNFVGTELNPVYAAMARERIDESIEPSLW
jgi:DNA modification methylase